MPDGGKLTIEACNVFLDEEYSRHYAGLAPGQYVVISVTDDGMGMPSEVVDKALDPFFTTKEAGKGTGLGLSQAYGFVKQSGGHLKIYSEIGIGTTIKLYLPRYVGQSFSVPQEAPVTNEENGRGETILVVEDEEGVRDYAVQILKELNYQGFLRQAIQLQPLSYSTKNTI